MDGSGGDRVTRLICGLSSAPGLIAQVVLKLRGVFTTFKNVVTIPLILSNTLKLAATRTATVVDNTVFITNMTAVVRSHGFNPMNTHIPYVVNASFAFISPTVSINLVNKLPTVLNTAVLNSIIRVITSLFLGPLLGLFPPLMANTIIYLVNAALVPMSVS